jgi:NhaA family Na+:H+ antiporter
MTVTDVRPPRPSAPLIERVLRPFQAFAHSAAGGGIVLLACAALALAWANSPWAAGYEHLWEVPLTVGVPGFGLTLSLHHWINDGLMAVFFFVVGLEIKREVLVGELASLRRAALPMAAALGGMVVPALLYALLNAGGPGAPGWGIPMATDIAFALGILALVGDRVPLGLKVFLTALAIVDDIGAVLVIALFYSHGLQADYLIWGAGVLLLLATANSAGVRNPWVYGLLGVVLWTLFLKSGIHATVAGVLLAFTIPARTRIDADDFVADARAALDDFESAGAPGTDVLANPRQQEAIQAIESAAEDVQSPLLKLEDKLHGLVSFGIMPLFALANAGVALGGPGRGGDGSAITLGIILGLVLGKPIGITLFSWLAVRTGFAERPAGAGWGALHAVSWLGGIGFTMSLFVAGLAFAEPWQLASAKMGILGASAVAGVVGFVLVRLSIRAARPAAREAGAEG